jgi:hypothetical protein
MYDDLVGEKVNVIFDPFDMSRVLVTNDKDIRFVATTAQLSPRALEDTYTGSRTYLNSILTDKKEQSAKVEKRMSKVRAMIPKDNSDAMALMQGGILTKAIKNNAEQAVLEDSYNPDREKFLDDNYNLNDFFTQNSNNNE